MLNEADTRAKLIDPAIHKRGWTEDLIRREETAGTVEIINGKARRRSRGKIDYVLRVKVNVDTQPVALALIEAKKESLPPGHGLDQAKGYAECKRLNVHFVFSTNGHQFVEFDCFTGLTSAPRPIAEFPDPGRASRPLRAGHGLHPRIAGRPAAARSRTPAAKAPGATTRTPPSAPSWRRSPGARSTEQPKRALLSLATGAGKTFIAVNLLKRISDAGQLTRALFVCDRDELRTQALRAFQNVFGSDAAEVFRKPDGTNNAKNARIHIATYQTLGVDTDDGDANFLTTYYPEDYFTHIVIDECHRSAWGKWSQVLTRNRNAVQIGLTATPRQLECERSRPPRPGRTPRSPPTTSPTSASRSTSTTWPRPSRTATSPPARSRRAASTSTTPASPWTTSWPATRWTPSPASRSRASRSRSYYVKTQFEDRILLPDRVLAMCQDLFNYLLETGGPEQKTIIFCARDRHADDVAVCLNNLYATWCADNGKQRLEYYAFKCTAASSGNDQLPDLRASSRSHFIATTVDLLTTGVDVPCVRNIVFFKYVKIAHQLLPDGRPRHAHRRAHRQADVPRLRLHRRHAPLRRGLHHQAATPQAATAPNRRPHRRRNRRSASRASTCTSPTPAASSSPTWTARPCPCRSRSTRPAWPRGWCRRSPRWTTSAAAGSTRRRARS